MGELERRRLRILVADDDGRVAMRDRDLPAVDVEFDDGTTAIAIGDWLRSVGLRPWFVECLIDQTDEAELAGSIREVLVQLPPAPPGWSPSPGWTWGAAADLSPSIAAGLREPCADRVAEWTGARPVPSLRVAWSRPGWFESAAAWIDRVLAIAGRSPAATIEQFRHWGISTILRVELVDGGRCWFKASFPPFRHEAAVTVLLDRWTDGGVTPVIAADVDAGWLLLDDLGPTGADSPEERRAAIDHLVALQRRLAGCLGELEAAGCPRRPITDLAGALDAALAHPVAAGLVDVTPGERRHLVGAVAGAAAVLADAGAPTTLTHGDFHPGNVAVADGRIVVFDWSDACLSTPFVDAVTWAWWYQDDPEGAAGVWSSFTAAWEREFGIDAGAVDQRSIETVAGAFHAISYVTILAAVEPCGHVEYVRGLRHFLDLLRASCT